jgi:hypothetical protein
MPLDYITQKVAHQRLLELFRKDKDTGLRPHFQEAVLEPANPFKPDARRWIKLPALFFVTLTGSGLLGFILFTISR